jgi:hypothetical protein
MSIKMPTPKKVGIVASGLRSYAVIFSFASSGSDNASCSETRRRVPYFDFEITPKS